MCPITYGWREYGIREERSYLLQTNLLTDETQVTLAFQFCVMLIERASLMIYPPEQPICYTKKASRFISCKRPKEKEKRTRSRNLNHCMWLHCRKPQYTCRWKSIGNFGFVNSGLRICCQNLFSSKRNSSHLAACPTIIIKAPLTTLWTIKTNFSIIS